MLVIFAAAKQGTQSLLGALPEGFVAEEVH